ncbi:hypothetical protein Vafri_14106 [Volvox africanus]|uniref:Uncharacterized protein n=1 Tax=Volvox africanus TaxID=51714 RepID=A0A8J4BE84_9CHLO|nr:hypothetical protein Vafri_14106 [Volvox africanus]
MIPSPPCAWPFARATQLLDLGTRHQSQEAGLAACRSWVQEQLGEGTATASGLGQGTGGNGAGGGGHGGGLVFLAGELKRCLHGTQAVAERLRSSEASCTALRLQSTELAAQLHSAQSLAASLRQQLATRDEELAVSLTERGRLGEAVAAGEDLVEGAETGLRQLTAALQRLQERFTGSFMAAMERAAAAAADAAAARRRSEELEATVKSAAAADAAAAAGHVKVSTADAWTSTADRMQCLTASALDIAGGSVAVSLPSATPTVAQQQLPSGPVLATPLASTVSTATPGTAAIATIPRATHFPSGLPSNDAQEPILMAAGPLRPSLLAAVPLNIASGDMKSLGRPAVTLATAEVATASLAGAPKQAVVTSVEPAKPQLQHKSNQERIVLAMPASRDQAETKIPDADGVIITTIEAAATEAPPTLAPLANSDASGRLGVLHASASPRGFNEVSAATVAAAVIGLKPAVVTSIPSPSAVDSGAKVACAARAAVELVSGVDPTRVDVGGKGCGQAAHNGVELVQQEKEEYRHEAWQPRPAPQPLRCDRGWEHLSQQQQEPCQQQQPELLQRQQRFQSPDARQQHRQDTGKQSASRPQPPSHLAPRSAVHRSSSTSPVQHQLRTTSPSHQSTSNHCNDEQARSVADRDSFPIATAAEGVVTPLAPLKAGSVEVMHGTLLLQQQKQAPSHTVDCGAVELQQQKAAFGEYLGATDGSATFAALPARPLPSSQGWRDAAGLRADGLQSDGGGCSETVLSGLVSLPSQKGSGLPPARRRCVSPEKSNPGAVVVCAVNDTFNYETSGGDGNGNGNCDGENSSHIGGDGLCEGKLSAAVVRGPRVMHPTVGETAGARVVGKLEGNLEGSKHGEHMGPWLAAQDLHGGPRTPMVGGAAEAAAVACEALASPAVAVPEASVKVPDLTAEAAAMRPGTHHPADVAVRGSCEVRSDAGGGGGNHSGDSSGDRSCCTYLELNKGLMVGRFALLPQLVLHQSPSVGEDEPTAGMATQGFREEIAAVAAGPNTIMSFDCIGQETTRCLQMGRSQFRQHRSPVEMSKSVRGRGEGSGTGNGSGDGIVASGPYIPVPDCGPSAHSGLRIGAVDVSGRVMMTSPDAGRGKRPISCLGKPLDDEDTCKGAADGESRSFAGTAASISTGNGNSGSGDVQDNSCGVIVGRSSTNAGAAAVDAVNGLGGQLEFCGVNMPHEARVEPWVARKRPRSALAGLFSAFDLAENSQEGEYSQGREAGEEGTERG